MLGFAVRRHDRCSFWSLLQPAIERAEAAGGTPAWLVATAGFLFGALFMWASDKAVSVSRLRIGSGNLKRIVMLVLSITLHNIPEGACHRCRLRRIKKRSTSPESLMAAVSIALGIGLQNFRGCRSFLSLRREGFSRLKKLSHRSGIRPGGAHCGNHRRNPRGLCGSHSSYALSFAAGSMILVVVHELIPECQQNRGARPYTATLGIVAGFAVMMLLDVMLG